MPIHTGKDSKGPFFQYGDRGAKYRYKAGSPESRARARNKAEKQAAAIKASQARRGKPQV